MVYSEMKQLTEWSRDSHNQKPQPLPDIKTNRRLKGTDDTYKGNEGKNMMKEKQQ